MSEHYIRALFYKTPKFKFKYWVNWLISIRTMSKYSHCSIWTPKEDGFFDDDFIVPKLTYYQGTCYTSTMRGDDNGTVKRDASLVLDHPERWEYVEIEMHSEFHKCIVEWMDEQVEANKGYSKWDILKFISPIHFPDTKRNICSEFVNNALCVSNVFGEDGWGIISPKAVLKKLLKCGYKVRSLSDPGPTQQDIDNIITEVNREE